MWLGGREDPCGPEGDKAGEVRGRQHAVADAKPQEEVSQAPGAYDRALLLWHKTHAATLGSLVSAKCAQGIRQIAHVCIGRSLT
jgi:hypothetical protein